jgi:UDP-galactopyranose mutase
MLRKIFPILELLSTSTLSLEDSLQLILHKYPKEWNLGDEPYYPINNDNDTLSQQYKALVNNESNIYFGGRLEYRYYDMHQVGSACN